MRDDFSEETKKQLSKRVGHYCSFPGCGSLTIGPSSESKSSTSSIGTAAHIAAASSGKGARRYVATMTPEERKDISNGIWMCNNHGKLIDTDETRFSITLIQRWKEIAEGIATLMLEKGCDYKTALTLIQGASLADNEVQINTVPTKGIENEIVGNAIHDSCVPILWGIELSDAVKDYVIEHVRNAFTHGKATFFKLHISDSKLVIVDDGTDYNPRTLFNHVEESGGALAVKHLFTDFGNKIVFATGRVNGNNQTTISTIKTPSDVYNITPCTIEISFEDFHEGNLSLTINETCKETFIVLPRHFALSDAVRMPERFPQFDNHSSSLIFIVNKSSSYVSRIIAKNYPNSNVMVIN